MIGDAMDADRLVQQALEYMEAGDFDRAKALLKKAAAAAPLRADIRVLLVQVMARRPVSPGKSGAAENAPRVEEPAPAAHGSRFWLWMTVGSLCLLLVLGGIGVAAYYLTRTPSLQFAGSNDSSPETRAMRDATGSGPEVARDDPSAENRKRLHNQALEAAEKGNYADAIRIMGVLLQTAPPDPEVYEKELARWHFELGREDLKKDGYTAAIENFSRATRLDSRNSDYYFWEGYARFLKGRRDTGSQKDRELQAAEKALVEAVRLDPDNLKVYDTLAKTYIALGRKIPDGRNCYYEIINRAPNSPEAIQAQKDLRDMGLR